MNRLLPGLLLATTAAAASADSLAVADAWVRATPPGATTGAAYLSITNHGPAADRLIGVRSDAAREVEVHTTINEGGVMKMIRLDTLTVASGETATLEPGGRHLMFMGLRKPFAPGDTITVTLIFEQAGRIELEIPVLDARTKPQ